MVGSVSHGARLIFADVCSAVSRRLVITAWQVTGSTAVFLGEGSAQESTTAVTFDSDCPDRVSGALPLVGDKHRTQVHLLICVHTRVNQSCIPSLGCNIGQRGVWVRLSEYVLASLGHLGL